MHSKFYILLVFRILPPPRSVFNYLLFVLTLGTFFFTPTEVKASETLYFVHQDHLGSTSLVTDTAGKPISKQTHFPYGATRSYSQLTADNSQPERQYTGQVSDNDETGLYYYNARYYNPQIGKFSQADKFNSGSNKYAYVRNNPIRYNDPEGYQEKTPTPEGDQLFLIITSVGVDCDSLNCNPPADYKDEIFQSLFSEFVKENPGWETLPVTEKIELMTYFLNKEVPYSSKYTKLDRNIAELRENGMRDIDRIRTLNGLYNMNKQYRDLKMSLSAAEEFEQDMVLCSNYAQLLGEWVNQALPELPVYTVGLPGKNGYESHAVVMFMYDDNLFVADPTNKITLSFKDYKNSLRRFDWSNYYYYYDYSFNTDEEE